MTYLDLRYLVLLIALYVDVVTGIDNDVQALRHWYTATGGTQWLRKDGWTQLAESGASSSIARYSWCQWYGVRCTNTAGAQWSHKEISTLDLSGNNLRGTLPIDAFEVSAIFGRLEVLNLSHNFLHCPATSDDMDRDVNVTFGALQSIIVADLSFNHFNCSVRHWPLQLSSTTARFTKLRVLKWRSNFLSGVMGSTPFRGGSLSIMYPALEVLDLGENHIVGEFPSLTVAHNAPRLQELYLDNNYLINTELTWLHGILSEGGSEGLPWQHSLRVLHLQYNYLQATIPRSIGLYTSIQDLQMQGNRMYGTIPREVRRLRSLHTLSLAHNYLRGRLPCEDDNWFGEVASFPMLISLDVSDNDLEGTGCHVAQSHGIQVMRLSDNAFRGTLPRIEGKHLREVTLGGENRWSCELPEPAMVSGWVDQPPSTRCFFDVVSTPGVSPGGLGDDIETKGSWWRNGLFRLFASGDVWRAPAKDARDASAHPMGSFARNAYSVFLASVVIVPLLMSILTAAGVDLPHVPVRLPGSSLFLQWVRYDENPTLDLAEGEME